MTKYFWIISAVLLIAANESFSQNVIRNVAQQKLAVLCRGICKDKNLLCPVFALNCENNPGLQLYCAKTCGVCDQCPKVLKPGRPRSAKDGECEMGSCKDIWEPVLCERYKKRNLCYAVEDTCRKTCDVCRTCKLPPPPPPCTPDCKDTNDSCDYWNKQKYCDVKKGFPDVRNEVCRRTCGVCTYCPPEEEGLTLPPRPE
ncbi:unnamed protein product [Clavelina lepadiformis]|uniref:ShKT domain-containing protein n=1 Tax=Clavelina lepadiformis TaxID=159417 RepID=A0ABP0FYZ2_CLALP